MKAVQTMLNHLVETHDMVAYNHFSHLVKMVQGISFFSLPRCHAPAWELVGGEVEA